MQDDYASYAKHIDAPEKVFKWIESRIVPYLKNNRGDQGEIEHIIDYLASTDAPNNITAMTYEQAKKNTDKWTKTLIKRGANIKELESDTEVILDFKDGFRIVKLVGEAAFKREGTLMSNCVASYYGRTDTEVYSLRDKDNMPHATMEKDQQVKGKGNGDIHPKYVDYVVKFLEHIGMTVGDSEMQHLGYVNLEKFKDELSKDTPYFNGKYVPKTHKLLGNDGKAFASLDLLDVMPLVSDYGTSLRINFELPAFIKLSIEYINKKISAQNASSGYSATNASSGYSAKNASSGDSAKNASSGDSAKNASSGHSAKNASSGDSATNASSGNYATNASSGDSATNASSGDYAKNEMSGQHSVSVDAGHGGKAKGKIGCWFCLSEWKKDGDIWKPVCVKAVQIDGKIIKEDQWYKLVNGEFVETNDSNE